MPGSLIEAGAGSASTPAASLARAPKVVHIATVGRTLGFLNGQIRYLKAQGFDIEGIAADDGLLHAIGAENNMPMHAVRMTRKIDLIGDCVALVRLWRILRRLRPDIVHTHTPKGSLLGIVAAALARVPVRIHHIHGLPHLTARNYRRVILKTSERLAASLATRTICVSRSIMQAAIHDGISHSGKAKVLLSGSVDGVDGVDAFNPARHADGRQSIRQTYGIPEHALTVGCVARLVPDKGIPELVEAWLHIQREAPGAHLLLVGTDEREHPLPGETLHLLRTAPNVHVTGLLFNIGSVYAALDILVLPSHREGMGAVLLEGAAMGLPIVTTRVPGCIDAVEEGVTAVLVDVRSPAALAAAILGYMHDAQRRHDHGIAGRARVLQLFERTALWAAVHEEYRQLLDGVGC
jgi:glycosyltransferase involved in cell wall biosynthesis